MGIGLPLVLEGQRLSQRYRIMLNGVKQAFACFSQVNRDMLPYPGHSGEMPVWPLFPMMSTWGCSDPNAPDGDGG
jgi:hypothetical protein